MKLLYFLNTNHKPTLGLETAAGILDVDSWCEFSNIPKFSDHMLCNEELQKLNKIITEEDILPHFFLQEDKITITSCVPHPSKIICIGLNYRKHAAESNMAVPTVPVVFNKFNNTLLHFEQDVSLGNVGEQFDYEVELGVVIGKKCKNIKKEQALHHVLGYCTANDMSCRDLQFRSSQWLMGKSLDGFLPLGKYVVTTDEIPDPQNLELTCWVNGERRQHSNTSDMIFSITEIIEDLSHHMTLEPGDLILTGTPAGVILGMAEKNWLKPGDVVKVEIEKLGASENKMIA
jgi:2-keto-4-pentenoate hydratase/2-oxohepta-3-ene-1,7-dioic acid hydratase in catechol pathway